MKKFVFWSLGIGVSLFILGSLGWIFRGDILDFWDGFRGDSGVAVRRGVPRKISYLGRLREARKLLEHDYFDSALIELAAAIREKPGLKTPYFLMGEVYLRAGNLEKLDRLLEQIEAKFPNDRGISGLKIRRILAEGDLQKASAELKKMTNPSPEAEFYRAILLGLQNDHEGAGEILSKLEKLPVQRENLRVGAEGVESVEAGERISQELARKVSAVRVAYEEFSEFSDGKNPHLFAKIAKSLAENDEAALAMEFAEVALKEDSEYIDAWILRGYANLQLRKFEDAVADLRHAYSLDSMRPRTHYFLALALLEVGNLEEAVVFFEKSLEHEFEFADAVRWKLIDLLTKSGKYDRAVELYEELLDDSADPRAFLRGVQMSVDFLKKPEAALSITTKLVELHPEDVFTMNIHAWALIANKKFAEAEQWLETARRADKENPRTFLNLGLLREQESKFEEARQFYKKSYEFGEARGDFAVSNLAVERHNELLARKDNPEEPAAPEREANSP